MFHTFKHLRSSRTSARIFVISFSVFAALNVVENLLHYSIGRSSGTNTKSLRFERPSTYDMLRIIGVMAVFAVLQALLTCYFLGC